MEKNENIGWAFQNQLSPTPQSLQVNFFHPSNFLTELVRHAHRSPDIRIYLQNLLFFASMNSGYLHHIIVSERHYHFHHHELYWDIGLQEC